MHVNEHKGLLNNVNGFVVLMFCVVIRGIIIIGILDYLKIISITFNQKWCRLFTYTGCRL